MSVRWLGMAAGLVFTCGGGGAMGAPPPEPAAPAAPKSLWCDNVVEMQTSRRSGVTSVWLSNGVRVHHLKLDRRSREVVVTIALSGGKLLEDARNRGVTELLAGVLDDWDAAAPNASAAEQMAGRDVRIDGAAGPDAITLRLAGSVADAPSGMKVVRELLSDARVTPEAVERSREPLLRELHARGADPRGAMTDAINAAIAGEADPRLLPPDERVLRAINARTVRAWLARHVKADGAPIEVGVVGDLTLAEALALVDATLGTLPARARVDAGTNRAERMVQGSANPAPGPLRKNVPGVTQIGAGRATIVCGCPGPEMGDLRAQRTLRAVVRLAIERIKARLADPAIGVAAGGSEVAGGVYVSPFIGRGMVLLTATVEGGKAAAVLEVVEAELIRLATAPATPGELEQHARELGKSVQEVERDARYWSAALSRCDGLGIDADEIAEGAAFYRTLTPERARDTFAQFWREADRFTLTLRGPERGGEVMPAPGGKR